MSDEGRFRRLRGALGNAVAFAACWSIAAFVIWLPMRQAGILPSITILSGVGIAIRIGMMGFITGFAFPSIMRVAYRGKRLSEISWARFGIVGGIVCGLFVPTFMETMSLLTGGGIVPLNLITTDIVLCTVLGALATAFSLRIAQYAESRFPETFQYHLDRLEKNTLLTAAASRASLTRGSRAKSLADMNRPPTG